MLNEKSIVVGVDVHKYSHTAVAMNAWGEERGTLNFTNNTLEIYRQWLEEMGLKENIVIGLEDVNSYGLHLVEELRSRNYQIRYVPAILTERERNASTKHHKSDEVDARRVGKVLLTKYEETLPAKESIADKRELEIAKSLDLLLMERRDLTKQKTITKNKHHFSMYAGIAPMPHSSGRKNRMHTNPFGNRQLNRAIHSIALSQIAIKGDPIGKEYYQKKLKEGKTKLWALRCLKHQIAKVVFQKLRYA